MKIEIYRHNKEVESYDAAKLITVPTINGMIGFLEHHMNYMGETVDGSVEIKLPSKNLSIAIKSGYALFKNNVCQIFECHDT